VFDAPGNHQGKPATLPFLENGRHHLTRLLYNEKQALFHEVWVENGQRIVFFVLW
jgi:hypothetical protein